MNPSPAAVPVTLHRQGPHTPPAARWSPEAVEALLALPLPELLFRAQLVHREHFDPCRVQLSTLLSIKTGGCPEDCAYCPQSVHFDTGIEAGRLMPLEAVVEAARAAQAQGATRFCMGAAWRSPKPRDMPRLAAMVGAVRALGLQTCMTLGMLDAGQAQALADAGLDFYNHNLDSDPAFYGRIVGTRSYQDRLDTLAHARAAGLRLCCGGIVGLGETRRERAGLIAQLASLEPPPESVPVNELVQVPGTQLHGTEPLDPFEFVRCIAAARITMPRAWVRLSAGREQMDDALQALCFVAGANAIFHGERLLTTANPQAARDRALLERLGMQPC